MAESSGWALSADQFRQRWNSQTEASYHIDGFHRNRLGRNEASLPGASVYAENDTFEVATMDRSNSIALCLQTVQAALGVPAKTADALVATMFDQFRKTLPSNPYGSVEYQGYSAAMTVAANGEFTCWVKPKQG
ncbi:hypothetical protein [Dyella agri]|uniref:Uncharacterized protein n=1 Tax=Dyella agri TaxID=1926869 RepID=A0ABW8KKA8_9GAMM